MAVSNSVPHRNEEVFQWIQMVENVADVEMFRETEPFTNCDRTLGKILASKMHGLTAVQFYAHRLMIFDTENPLPHGGALLFQQFIVDAYCRAEAQRLAYLRLHQDDLRAEEYITLREATQAATFNAGETKVGKRIVLPSSYPGSPRAMQQNYLDAMAIVRRLGT